MISVFYLCDSHKNKNCKKTGCGFLERGYCFHTSDHTRSKYWKHHEPTTEEIAEFFEAVEGSNGFYWAEKLKLSRKQHIKRKNISSLYSGNSES